MKLARLLALTVALVGALVGLDQGARAEGDSGRGGDEAFLRGMVEAGVLPPDFMEAWALARFVKLTRQERFIEFDFRLSETSFGVSYTAYCYRDNFLILDGHMSFGIRSQDQQSAAEKYKGERSGSYACLERFRAGGAILDPGGGFSSIRPSKITEVVGPISFDSRNRITTEWECAKQDHPWSDAVFRCSPSEEYAVPDLIAEPDRALLEIKGYRLRSTVAIQSLYLESIERDVYDLTCEISTSDVEAGVVSPLGSSCYSSTYRLPVEIGSAVIEGYFYGLYCQTANDGTTRCAKWRDER